ncbi:LysR family transcriptional regulator [Caldimonas sp. KR1-144]|uniref:LysR family transcriptional regulator n=1 Tax=Caldimonas sp. KR1-144 TaxID=3400911 RepID=UPI003BFFED31
MNHEPLSGSIELRAWRQFAVLAETLHFGRAAARLHMTQPPLTQAIQQLERRLGVALFVRSKRSVALSAAGEALLAPVQALLAAAAALPAIARDAAAGQTGRLRLAFVSSIGYGPLPRWLRGFREAHPGVTVELREATADVQLPALERGDIDAGFVLHAPQAAPAGLAALTVLEEPLVLALPEAHVLATRARIASLAALDAAMAEPLVTIPRAIAPSLHDAILAGYQRRGLAPRIAQEAIQMQTIVNLVAGGLGVAWVPASVSALQRPGVVYRALERSAAATVSRVQTSLVWRGEPSPALHHFIAHIERHPAAATRR